MGELLYDSTNVTEILQTSSPILPLRDPISTSFNFVETADLGDKTSWETFSGLEDQQRRYLQKLHSNGVMWKHPDGDFFPPMIFRLSHGGDVDADGNCLFTASKKAMGSAIDARELRRRTVARFLKDLGSEGGLDRGSIDATIKHLYTPDLRSGWGINVVQEVKLLAKKVDRDDLDKAISELVDLGLQRDAAAESIYKGRCLPVDDSLNWAKYMSISGSPDDEYDIISLQYTEEGLLTVDDNRDGHAAAFGDDIAIEFLATEFMREIYVVQAHGSDAMVDDENCVFFLPHRPRSRICEYPFFLFMKGTGWCGAGADHYEPLIAHPAPLISEEKAAVLL